MSTCDAHGGASGSPLPAEIDGELRVVGVLTSVWSHSGQGYSLAAPIWEFSEDFGLSDTGLEP
ncbi:MAG: hypothetical protein AAFW88_00785 [Pseudomonadota bacterium]